MSAFPLEEVTIKEATIVDGVLTLIFNDPRYRTSGGSCRVITFRRQITKTVLQFPWMKKVVFDDEQFQP
jgi:hypothetical protein